MILGLCMAHPKESNKNSHLYYIATDSNSYTLCKLYTCVAIQLYDCITFHWDSSSKKSFSLVRWNNGSDAMSPVNK